MKEKKRKGLDNEQIYGHGSERGSMPGMTGSKLLLLRQQNTAVGPAEFGHDNDCAGEAQQQL
jgi:hypothetical protein